MTKLTLSDVNNILGNPTSAQSRINSNNTLIEAAIENTLSRDGTSPNQMGADLDMNDNDILNVNIIQSEDFIIGGKTVTGVLKLASEAAIAAAASAGDASDSASAAAAAIDTKMAAFGLGGAAASVPGNNIDSNTIPNGFYYVNGATSGTKPAGDDGYGHLIVSREGSGVTARQLYLDNNTNRIWTRTWAPSQWSSWVELYHSGNIGTATSELKFTQPGAAAVRTVQDKLREFVNVKDFGAKGDGVTDDTEAINAALNAVNAMGAVSLYFPAGIYLYRGGGWLGNGVVAHGDGRNATTIRSRLASPTSGYLFRASGYGSGIRGLRFDAAVTQTAGSYVWLSGPETFIEDFHMTGDFNGVWMTGNVSRIRHGRFQDGAPGAIRIKAEGGDNSQLIDDVLMGAQTPQVSAAGIRVRNSSALIISNTSVIQQGYGLLIDPYSGTPGSNTADTDSGSVYSLYVHHCFFDNNSQDAVRIEPTGNASVVRIRFDNCWMSSSTNSGIIIVNYGTGSLQGAHFESCHVGLNGGSGLTTGGTVSDIQVLGGWFCQNVFGMYFNEGASNITISGCTIGSGAGLAGNTNDGIVLDHDSINNVVITNNRMIGNGGAAIIDMSTGPNKIIFNNTGASGVGTSIDISGPAGGQIKFPANQNASPDPNTLDDYEEGDWTPTLTFATPGDLSVSYISNNGKYTKIGRMVVARFQIVTSNFTQTTASGSLIIDGLPFEAAAGFGAVGALWCEGITKTNYTMFVAAVIEGTKTIRVSASGSGQPSSYVAAADVPSGGTVTLRGTVTYFV